MWIPTPVYERLPQFWLLLGLLFMASGVFLGFDYWLSFVYFITGFVCCGWSAWTLTLRIRNRQAPANAMAQAETLDTAAETPLKKQRRDPVASV